MTALTSNAWDDFLAAHPDAHILQTVAWGDLKASFGWEVLRLAAGGIGAQILFRSLPFGLHIAYLPKGPVAAPHYSWDQFWLEVDAHCRERKAIFLKIAMRDSHGIVDQIFQASMADSIAN